MSVNTSSNESFLHQQPFVNKLSIPLYLYCYISGTSSFIYSSFLITNICAILPLCIFILHYGHQQWQQNRRLSSGAMSHSDCLTYHLVTMELIGLSGCAVACCGIYCLDLNILAVGNFIFDYAWFGEILFHVLTCLERYLAVAHPITYRNLRNERGVRVRNISYSCVWLFCFVVIGLENLNVFPIINACLLTSSLTIVLFCCLSVLFVLNRSGPGKTEMGREKLDQSKQKAFNTILAVLKILVVKFIFNIMWELFYFSKRMKACVIISCFSWINLPCSLVLPLMFLHRVGKLVCCKNNITRLSKITAFTA